ncbi:MAG: restriction endonuclease, SacI family [SAR202 cluster bacterium]|nr:restriction endonuclease, SacI family [SAR202 cluster bacterium]
MPIDYDDARRLLNHGFQSLTDRLLSGEPHPTHPLSRRFDALFTSRTQSYREVLLGCLVARALDASINITMPYAGQGPGSFNGRTLDERVVNPFLRQNDIPCSRGAYLAVFRRSVSLSPATRQGLRDKAGFDALLSILESARTHTSEGVRDDVLPYALYQFWRLREESRVNLVIPQRLSLQQLLTLSDGLLKTRSGGRVPVLLTVALLRTLKDFFQADWEIEYQGINVADAAKGKAADIEVRSKGATILAAEITERAVDETRVRATFATKIAVQGISDYLFVLSGDAHIDEVLRRQTQQYFAQGHEVNFVDIRRWMEVTLATLGQSGRAMYVSHLTSLLGEASTPKALKAAWNSSVNTLLAATS